MQKKRFLLWMMLMMTSLTAMAASYNPGDMTDITGKEDATGKGKITVKKVARNAVRVQYTVDGGQSLPPLPDWLYVKDEEVKKSDITVNWDANGQVLRVCGQALMGA